MAVVRWEPCYFAVQNGTVAVGSEITAVDGKRDAPVVSIKLFDNEGNT